MSVVSNNPARLTYHLGNAHERPRDRQHIDVVEAIRSELGREYRLADLSLTGNVLTLIVSPIIASEVSEAARQIISRYFEIVLEEVN